MMLYSMLVLFSVLAAVYMIYVARGHRLASASLEEIAHHTHPIDLDAFRNLMDASEETFLRSRLLPADFRRVQRQRLFAAAAYVRATSDNAAILMRLGESARTAPDPATARAAATLVEQALTLRMLSLALLAKVYMGILLPQLEVSPARLADRYEQLSAAAMQVCRLRDPRSASAIEALLIA
jgi:hypothetical protein